MGPASGDGAAGFSVSALLCPGCYLLFEEPVTLQCNHTLCTACAQKSLTCAVLRALPQMDAERVAAGERYSIACPTCSAETRVTGVEELRPSRAVAEAVEQLRGPTPCENECGREAAVECAQCAVCLCADCDAAVHALPATSRHPRGPRGAILSTQRRTCAAHGHELALYCRACNALACVRCATGPLDEGRAEQVWSPASIGFGSPKRITARSPARPAATAALLSPSPARPAGLPLAVAASPGGAGGAWRLRADHRGHALGPLEGCEGELARDVAEGADRLGELHLAASHARTRAAHAAAALRQMHVACKQEAEDAFQTLARALHERRAAVNAEIERVFSARVAKLELQATALGSAAAAAEGAGAGARRLLEAGPEGRAWELVRAKQAAKFLLDRLHGEAVPLEPLETPRVAWDMRVNHIARALAAFGRLGRGVGLHRTADFDENGAIFYIGSEGRQRPYANPAKTGAVRVTRSSAEQRTRLEAALGRPSEHGCWVRDTRGPPWLAVDLRTHTLLPSAYTLAHALRDKNNSELRHWRLEGSRDGEAWELLREHTDDASIPNSLLRTATWSIEAPARAYRLFRVRVTGDNWSGNREFLNVAGLELYGLLFEGDAALD